MGNEDTASEIQQTLHETTRRPRKFSNAALEREAIGEIRDAVDRICQRHNYEPMESLVKLRTTMIPLYRRNKEGVDEQMKDAGGNLVFVPLCGPEKAIAIDMELCKYKHSQKKSVDLKTNGPMGITVVLSDVPPAVIDVTVSGGLEVAVDETPTLPQPSEEPHAQ